MRFARCGATMQLMPDTEREAGLPTLRSPRRRRRLLRVLATLVVLATLGGALVLHVTRPPTPVSVSDVVNRYRSSEPSAGASAGDGPARGVYVYATSGWERISAGNITHHYPARTTLSVTDIACGLRIRWDALAGRWSQGDVCRTPNGWRLEHYIDAHRFLYRQDIHDYMCSGYPVVVCKTDSGVLTSTVETLSAGHLRITQQASGTSVNAGVMDVWLLPGGLPRRIVVENHGAQTILGARVTYTESATFTLTSTTPLR